MLGRLPLRLWAAALLSLTLGACGFQLRNALLLPSDLGPLRVVSQDPSSPLGQSLSEALTRTGATAAPANAAAGTDAASAPVATLRVVSEQWATTPLSVDQFGRALEYTLRYAVVFRLNRADGSALVSDQAIELSRDYISSPANVSGTLGEREILSRELRRDMVASILRRIDAALRGPAVTGESTPAGPAPPPSGS